MIKPPRITTTYVYDLELTGVTVEITLDDSGKIVDEVVPMGVALGTVVDCFGHAYHLDLARGRGVK